MDGCKRLFGITPVFLENFEEKKAIRNAIAHSQAEFRPKENEVRFFTLDEFKKMLYDKTMSFESFFLHFFELVDAIDSFYYAIELATVIASLGLAHSQRICYRAYFKI